MIRALHIFCGCLIVLAGSLPSAWALVGASADSIECNLASDYSVPGRPVIGTSDRQSSVMKYRYADSSELRYICVMDVYCQSRSESADHSEPIHTAATCAERNGSCPSVRECLESSGLQQTPGHAAPDNRIPRFGGSSDSGGPKRGRGPGSAPIQRK
jgi:hypothetical protein